MTKTKYNRQTPHSRIWSVRLSPEILDYLSAPTKFGASRLSAYLHLLHNVAETTTPYKPMYGRTFNLETGQLVISITDLADKWNWARETVRKFFDQLEAFGLLSKSQLDRCSLVTMTMEWTDAGYESVLIMPQMPFMIPGQLAGKMDEWLNGDITDSELFETIGETLDSFDKEDTDAYSHRISSLQYSLIRQMIGKWYDHRDELSETADSYSIDCLGRIFNVCLSGNWSDWLRLLKGYSPGSDQEYNAVRNIKGESCITDARAALDGLFIHLKVDFIKDSL
ncbi:MAG TPA: hypothetical protein DD424_09070 [Porphyromonadaceae bacterium]|nr:hypothetical protein [Porphyromonadaceae bacterium]